MQQCLDYDSADEKSPEVGRVTEMLDKHSLGKIVGIAFV